MIDSGVASTALGRTISFKIRLNAYTALVNSVVGVPGHDRQSVRAGGGVDTAGDNAGLAGSRREIEHVGAVQISPDEFYGCVALKAGGKTQVLRDHRAGSWRADAYTYASDRAAKRQIASDAEVFLRLIEPAKVVPGVDDQMMRAVGDAALKQVE